MASKKASKKSTVSQKKQKKAKKQKPNADRCTLDIPAKMHPWWEKKLGLPDKKDKVKQVRYRYSVIKSLRQRGITTTAFNSAANTYRIKCTYLRTYT